MTWSGWTPTCTGARRSGRGASPSSTIEKDVRAVEAADLEGFDAVVHLAALSNDPLGDLNPQLTYDINHLASVRLADASPRRRASAASFSPRRAATTAPPATLRWTRTRSSTRSPPTASRRCAPSATSRRWPTTRSRPRSCAAPPPTASRRGCASTSCSTTSWPGPSPRARSCSRATARPGGRSSTSRTSPARSSPCWPRRARRCTARPSTWAATTRTTGSGRSREIVKETVPGCEIAFAEGAGPDKRNYRADFGKIARVLPDFQPQWDARKGARQLYEAYKRIGLKLEDFEGPALSPHRPAQAAACAGGQPGRADLRWRTPQLAPRPQAMIFTETKLKGAFIIDLERREDNRGFFARAFCQQEFAHHGLKPVIAQANSPSTSGRARCAACTSSFRRRPRPSWCACTRGAILDIIVDLRPESPTYLAARRGRADRRQPPRALRARALRARLPGPGGQHRDELPGRRVLHARRGGRAALQRSAARARVAAAGHGDLGQGRGLAACSTRSSRSCKRRMTLACRSRGGRHDHRRHRAEGPRGSRASPIRVGMIGAGFMGQGLTNQIVQQRPRHAHGGDLQPAARSARSTSTATPGCEDVVVAGNPERRSTTRSARGRPVVAEDAFAHLPLAARSTSSST